MNDRIVTEADTTGTTLPDLRGDIFYIIPVEDGDPYKASLLQGFAPSLINNAWIIDLINKLPGHILELAAKGQEIRLAAKMSGQAPIRWFGQSHGALTGTTTPEVTPFVVVFFGEGHDPDDYRSWIEAHPFPLPVVSNIGGYIRYDQFSINALREAFLKICDAVEGKVGLNGLDQARRALRDWTEIEERQLGYQVGGHNSVLPNLLALYTAGFRDTVYGPFKKFNSGQQPYVEQIVRTTRSVLYERNRVSEGQSKLPFRRPRA